MGCSCFQIVPEISLNLTNPQSRTQIFPTLRQLELQPAVSRLTEFAEVSLEALAWYQIQWKV